MQLGRTAVPVGIWATLLVIGSFLDAPAQLVVWAVALTADYAGIYLGGAEGWRLNAPAHFAERHGLIALGESIVALGVGAADEPVSAPLVTAVVRDSYTYLHFPMVAGIVFLALGLKKVIEYVADTEKHTLSDALTGIPLLALYGGVIIYLLAHVAFRLRNVHSVNKQRVVTAVVLVGLVPVAWQLPALVSLGLLAAILVSLIGYESTVHAEARHAVRHSEGPH